MAIVAEDFEGNGVVVVGAFEGADHGGPIDLAGADGQMEIAGAAFVIVGVDVGEAIAVGGAEVGGGVVLDEKIRVADVEVQAELRHAIEEPAEFSGRVVVTGKIFDHDADTGGGGGGHDLREAFEVHFDHEGAVVKWGVAIGMDVDPFGAEFAEDFDATTKFFGGAFAEGFEGAAEGQVVGGVADDFEAEILDRPLDRGDIDDAGAGCGGFESEVDEIELHLRHPAKFADNVTPGMIHRADFHGSNLHGRVHWLERSEPWTRIE